MFLISPFGASGRLYFVIWHVLSIFTHFYCGEVDDPIETKAGFLLQLFFVCISVIAAMSRAGLVIVCSSFLLLSVA